MTSPLDTLPTDLPRIVLEEMIVQRAIADGNFWNLLINDPVAALTEFFGTTPPPSLTIETYVEDADTMYYVVPYADYYDFQSTTAPNRITPRLNFQGQLNYLLETDTDFQVAFQNNPSQAVSDALNFDFTTLGVTLHPLYETADTIYIVLPHAPHNALMLGPYSAQFDGTASHITVPYAETLAIDDKITLEIWFKVPQFRSSQADVLISMLDDTGGWQLQVGNHIPIFTIIVDGTLYLVQSETPILLDDHWHYVVGAFDGEHLSLFVDGVMVAQTAVSGAITPPNEGTPLVMGNTSNLDSNNAFLGLIHEVRLWGDILHTNLIQSNTPARNQLDELPASVQEQLLAHYLFDEGTGTMLNDRGPFYHTGTLNQVIWQITGLNSPP